MKFCYAAIASKPKVFHRLTGLTRAEFDRLLDKFASQYGMTIVQPRLSAATRTRAPGGGRSGYVKGIEDKLFFILVYTRIYPLDFSHNLIRSATASQGNLPVFCPKP